MYKELSIYDKNLTDKEAIEYLFVAAKHNFGGVSTASYFLPRLKDIIPEGMVLACPVNYPDGNGDFQLIQHAIIAAQRKGANAIDLVLNPHYVTNYKLELILEEVACYNRICKDYDMTLRVMLDYRLFDTRQFIQTIDLLVDIDIDYIFPSTGNFADDIDDNLTMCGLILKKYPFLSVISTAPVRTKEQYEKFANIGVFGMRFYKPVVLDALGV